MKTNESTAVQAEEIRFSQKEVENQAKIISEVNELKEKLTKAREALKAAKEEEKRAAREVKESVYTPFGSTLKLMAENPNITFDELTEKLNANGVDTADKMSTIKGAYAEFTRFISILRANNHIK
jgi:hypothetical protein